LNAREVDRERGHEDTSETADTFDEAIDETTNFREDSASDSAPPEIPDLNFDERENIVAAHESGLSSPPSRDQMQKSMALFILTLKERYKVTQAAIDFTVTQMKENIDFVIDDLHQAVHEKIREVPGLTEDDAVRITSIFNNFSSPFTNLETQYFQSKFYEENFGLILSVPCFMQLFTCCVLLATSYDQPWYFKFPWNA